MVLDAAPVPAVTEVAAALGTGVPDEPGAGQDDNHDDSEPAIEFATKKQAFLSRYRGHPQYGLREAAGRVAAELAPLAGLQAGTGRTYIAEELRRIDAALAECAARGHLELAAPQGEQR